MPSLHVELFWLIFLLIVTNIRALFDVDEIHGVNYGISILNEPVRLSEGASDGSVYLMSKFGQQYQCSYTEQNADEQREKQEEKAAMETGITELLKEMENRPCLTNTKGWWTYEFCFGKYIRQYHVEDGQVSGSILYLGQYSSDYDWSNTTNLRKQRSWISRYHSQQYNNGSKCDLTGKPRRAEVKFYCERTQTDYISRVDETETCVYTITVQTPRICHHPYLKPPKPNKAIPITCNPLLADQEYQEYEHMKEKERRLEQLENQQLEMVPISSIETNMKPAGWDEHADFMVEREELNSNPLQEGKADPEQPLGGALEKLISDSLVQGLKDVFGGEAGDSVKVSNIKTKTLKKSEDLTKLIQEALSSSSKNKAKIQSGTFDLETGKKEVTDLVDEKESLMKEKKALEDEIEALIDENEALEDENEALEDENEALMDEDDGLIEDDDDAELLADFESGLEDLDISDESVAQLHEYKEALEQEMNAQFGDIIKEAQEELKDIGIDEIDINKDETMKTMSATLNKLLKQLDKKKSAGVPGSESDTDSTSEQFTDKNADPDDANKLSDASLADDEDDDDDDDDIDDDIINMEYDLEYGDSDPEPTSLRTNSLDQSRESDLKSASDAASQTEGTRSKTDKKNDDDSMEAVYRTEIFNDRGAKVKVTTKRYQKKAQGPTQHKQTVEAKVKPEQAASTTGVRDLKEVVLNKLEKAGVNTHDHKIQVKIFTSADYYEDVTGDMLQEAGGNLKKMMVAVLGANTDEIQEQKRHENMEENYGFVWKSKSASSDSLVDSEPEPVENTESDSGDTEH